MTAPTIEKAAPIPADDLVDAVAKAISRHGYTEQVKGDGFAWWWNSLHDHPGNVFAHECREDDRAKARLALQVIMQDRADGGSQEERIREDERATAAERDVTAERRRQVEDEGWTPEHDDAHEDEELAAAAGCYAWPSWTQQGGGDLLDPPDRWPWADSAWRPTNRRQMLVKAGALILAEIERLDRARLRGDAS